MTTSLVFADESGTDGECPCYSIGALVVPESNLDAFVKAFEKLRDRHCVSSELKWNRIGNSHGAINLVLDWLGIIQRTMLTFGIIVVNKAEYRLWNLQNPDREEAFYKTYTFLMKDLAQRRQGEFQVYIDDRQDRYDRRNEVLEIISNYMLIKIQPRSRIALVQKSDSKLVPGIQIADVLTGAINASHREYLDKSFKLYKGKRLLIDRLSQMLGWDALWYDTMPNADLNIWHFPIEYRAKPKTRNIVKMPSIPYVSSKDL